MAKPREIPKLPARSSAASNTIRLRAFITSPELQQRHYSRTAKDLVDVFKTLVFRQYYVHNHVSHLYRAPGAT